MFEWLRLQQARTVEDYQQMVWSLFPRGQAWTPQARHVDAADGAIQNTPGQGDVWQNTPGQGEVIQNDVDAPVVEGVQGGVLEALVWAIARELWRLDTRSVDLQNERLPGLAGELLSAHEAQLGIVPHANATLDERCAKAHVKKYTFGSVATVQLWENLCAQYGVACAVLQGAVEQTPRRMGAARMGETQPRMGYVNHAAVLIIEVPSATPGATLAMLVADAENYKRAHCVLVWRPV